EAVGLLGEGERGRYTISGWFLESAAAALADGDTQRAGQLAAAARDTDPQVPGLAEVSGTVYIQRAVEAMGEQDLDGALAFAEQATLVDPDDGMAHHLLGELRFHAGRFAEAVPALDRALRNSELDGEPLGLEVALMLARCQGRSGHKDDAIATLDEYLRRPATAGDPSVREAARALLRTLRAGD
ncbi:MAG: tetratricopeptide repeat protein, partial [Planctomycetota bacterium]